MNYNCNIASILGKTIVEIEGDEESVEFTTSDRMRCSLYPDLGESGEIFIESIEGNLQDLVGFPLTQAEEINEDMTFAHRVECDKFSFSKPEERIHDVSSTWTFYKLATIKGYVTIRFYGTSNGYYSERALFKMRAAYPYED